ncbi:heterokaryon incompatibility, partial [Lasiosphaeria ovina]
ATLSHRWPQSPLLLARTDNLQELQAQIPWDRLSKTFQGACTVAKALRIRYIWIDCLCIVQDDMADWEREAKKMGTFYELAYVTIAATTAESGLSPSDASKRLEKQLELPCDYTDIGAVPKISPTVDRSPLDKRGWVFQERLLSRRVLHFAEGQIYWEC